jgi:hypothetical protein
MIEDNDDLLQNKRYDTCFQCHKIIVYDIEAADRQGNLIPLDIDRKRYRCNDAQFIANEEQTVKEIKDIVQRANKFELTFPLELVIDDDQTKMMM